MRKFIITQSICTLIACLGMTCPVRANNCSAEKSRVTHGPVKEYKYEQEDLINHIVWSCNLKRFPAVFSYFKNQVDVDNAKGVVHLNPMMDIEPVGADLYRFCWINKHVDVDVSRVQGIDALIGASRPMSGLTSITKSYARSYECGGDSGWVGCDFYLEYPAVGMPHAAMVRQWLVNLIVKTTYWKNGKTYPAYAGGSNDMARVIRYCADRFFSFTDRVDYQKVNECDLRAYEWNDRYVTYQVYTNEYSGGAHGYHTERLVTLDLSTGTTVTPQNLFRQDCLREVRTLLLHAALNDDKWHDFNGNVTDFESAVTKFILEDRASGASSRETGKDIDRVDISRVGLTPEGVVFSYYPDELSCTAAGCFHFLISYEKLLPYLTKQGRRCYMK